MAFYNQGVFSPKNKDKYIGTYPIEFRSAWELTIMNVFDEHPNVEQWASESIEIPYISPVDGKWHKYIPDFFVIYVDKHNNKHGEIIEVKPASQTYETLAKSRKDQKELLINQAKWKYAIDWCKAQGIEFRIMTEEQIYQNARK